MRHLLSRLINVCAGVRSRVLRRMPVPGARPVLALWAALLLMATAPTAYAQHVTTHLSADSVTVGQRFFVTFVLDHDSPGAPLLPSDSSSFGDIDVIGLRSHDHRLLANGMRRDSVVYEVATFALDTAYVPAIPFSFSTATEDTVQVRSQRAFVPVISLVPPDAKAIHALKPLVTFPRTLWPWFLAGGVLLLVAAALAYRWWKRRQMMAGMQPQVAPAPELPPYEEALRRLQRLTTMDLRFRESVKPFFVEMTDAARTYLSRRLRVQALETTTRELLRDLHANGTVGDDDRHRLRALLELADFVKFADATPPVDQDRRALGEMQEVIGNIETTVRQRERLQRNGAGTGDAAVAVAPSAGAGAEAPR